MKKFLALIILFSFFQKCLTPDRDRQSLSISPETVEQNELNEIKVFKISDNDLDGKVFLLKANSNFVELLMSNFVVDNANSALIHLSQDYMVALVVVENRTREPKTFLKKNLNLIWEDKNLSPLTPDNYPKQINCFNWKGTAKNFYNFIAISAITIYTVNAIFACFEGNCREMEYLKKELDENHPSKKGSYFSDLKFSSTLDFNERLDLEGIVIAPNTTAKGIALYRDHGSFASIKKYLTKGNCVIN